MENRVSNMRCIRRTSACTAAALAIATALAGVRLRFVRELEQSCGDIGYRSAVSCRRRRYVEVRGHGRQWIGDGNRKG